MSASLEDPHIVPMARSRPRALVLRAPGTNCDRETVHALEIAGGAAEAVHMERVLAGGVAIDDYALIVLPGGFAFGDHLGAGALWANSLAALGEPLHRFVESGRPVLGICNGFQALTRLGLLTGGALAPNLSGHYECRWVWLEKPSPVTTPFLEGIERMSLPVGHGEGRFVAESDDVLAAKQASGEVALVYRDASGKPGGYPVNPNGSQGAVAGLTNAAGNVLGLMPHPDRNAAPGLAPAGRQDADGLRLFANAVRMAKG
ncbi:MAG: phosphoribosylformylglycinamidine synthase I [Thermomicrobiales bacterium]|nr:phosphoribosylformylglycinamidine synthase I [Thermomicrobiales bacterium]MCA9880074.1 phosphoribosylformylglycinamidine synthase I [Thermomicrobiales bacterium]